MNASDIPSFRLASQQLCHTTITTPEGMVRWLGAVQAQDYEGGLWSIGLPLPGSTRREVERALDDRKVVRTWAMRGTLHIIPVDDVLWVLSLVAPGFTAARPGGSRNSRLPGRTSGRPGSSSPVCSQVAGA